MVFNEGSANAPMRMKIDDSNLNIEEMKWSAAGTVPEAIGGNQDVPDEDGKTTKGDQPPDGVSVDGEPSERVSNNKKVLVHAPDLSDCTRLPPDVKLHRQIANIEVPVKQQVSRVQRQGKRPECTFDRQSSHLITPPSLYPVPIPTAAMRRSSRARRTLIHDNASHFFVNTYERATLEEEIQLNERGMDDLPSCIEALDDEGEMEACTDVMESRCDTLTQSMWCAATTTPLDNEPLTYNDAVEHPDADLWLAAMAIELNTFKEIGLYQEVEAPTNCKIINSKWVFKIKCGPNSEIDKYKARLIMKGYTQVEGLDYMDTFAPVTKFTTIHSLLALAAQHDLEVHQIDVKVAFLNSELDEEIYLRPPPGFHDNPKVVWHLLHALYGLKQVSKAWYDTLWKTFESLGFTRSEANHSLFHKDEDGDLLVVAVYVDEKLIFSKNLDAIKHLKSQMSDHFEITDLGEAWWILGMEVIRNCQQGTISLSQRCYVETILDHFGLKDG